MVCLDVRVIRRVLRNGEFKVFIAEIWWRHIAAWTVAPLKNSGSYTYHVFQQSVTLHFNV